jgi:phage/plasmid-like protein (TIGR03299 family)
MAHLVENMAFVGELPWHELGTKVSEGISSADMLKEAGLDWIVEQWSMAATNGDKRLIVDDCQHNVRIMPDGSISSLGSVGHKTHVLQNADAFSALDPYVQAGQATWETAGSLDNGRKVWAMLRIKDSDSIIRGNDRHACYAMITNPHDGSGSVRVGFSEVRIVCANTLRLAVNDKASKLIRINHSQHVTQRVNDVAETMDLVRREFAMSAEKYSWLATRKSINRSDLEKYTRIVFSLGDKPTIDLSNQSKGLIMTIEQLFENGKGNIGESWYDAYNAVTEYLSHKAGRTVENRYNSLWYGSGVKVNQLALDTAFELAV